MDRAQLTEWLADGLSLQQIGAMVGGDPSTVAYWLTKHGLVANGRAKHACKGGMPREDLGTLVNAGDTLAVIAEAFDVSVSTVRYWIDRYGLDRPIRSGEPRSNGRRRGASHSFITATPRRSRSLCRCPE